MQPAIMIHMNAAKTVTERVSDLRSRRKAQGLVKLELWVHENDVSRIKKDAAAHAARRARLLKQGFVVLSLEEEDASLIAAAKKSSRSPRLV
jgi:hypothetical protein